jgi:two-component system sensor kinase FixL
LKDSGQFLARIAAIEASKEKSFDLLELIDGKLVERYSEVISAGGKAAGRVWSFRLAERRHSNLVARRLAAIVDDSDDAIIGKDLNGIITSWNKGAERIFGYSAEEMIGTSIIRLIPSERQGEEEEILARIKLEYRLRRADGEYRWILDTGVPRYTKLGFAGYIGSCIDITEHKQAELQLQHQRDELAHLSRVTTLGEMATALAHELNQPLGAILSNAEAAEILLQKNPLDLDELRAILSDIRQDGWRAGEVIHRIHSLLKRHRFKMELIEVEGLVEALGGLLQAMMVSRKARLRIEIAPALPPVWGDTVQLQQVLLNLILNALDAMIDCTIEEREVVVCALPDDKGGVKISVTDQGTGFSKEKPARFFEPFFTTKKQGMGIGLSICQTIIEAHGGQLTAENNSSRGATLRFTLPAGHHKKENAA